MLTMVYGYEVKGLNDQRVKAARKLAQLIIESALPGALLINYLPFCKYSIRVTQVRRSYIQVQYIPEWLPWFSYNPLARSGYDIGHGPIQFVRETIVCIWTHLAV